LCISPTVSFDTEMIIGTDLPILGEVNILRHLSRIGPNEFDYESKDNCNEIDVVFDLCYMLKTSSSAKERQTAIKQLNNRLGKAQFFGDSNEISIGDVAFGSTIKQLESVIGKDLLPNLKALLLRTGIVKF
jgi:aminoacyl tRNA synthase complex-interacting multifunctional protein 2